MLHVYNHCWGLAMPYLTFTLPFAVCAALEFAELAPGVRRGVGPALGPALLVTALLAFIASLG